MRLKLLIISLLFGLVPAMAQHYSIHSATTGVSVTSGGKTVLATKGMQLKPTDNINIPNGGSAEILNSLDKRIYKSVRPGTLSVTKLMIEARQSAADKLASVSSKLNMPKGEGGKGKKVYVEKGMVNRSLAVFDPEGENLELDFNSLADYISSRLLALKNDTIPSGLILNYKNKEGESEESFALDNRLGYPVYFNLLEYDPAKGIEISRLGNPSGAYVVPDCQSISRSRLEKPAPANKTFVIVTPCQFDIDKVIEKVNQSINENKSSAQADDQIPVILYILN